MDQDQQRDHEDERATRADLQREGLAELRDPRDETHGAEFEAYDAGDRCDGLGCSCCNRLEQLRQQQTGPEPDTFEWHTARATEAIGREELDLAHAHLYLAEQLQNAIAMRAQAYLRAKLLTERFGKLSDEDLAKLDDLTARPGDGPSRNVQHLHMVTDGHLGAGRLACQTCGAAVMNVREGGLVSPGWWHLDVQGNPVGALDGHGPVLPS